MKIINCVIWYSLQSVLYSNHGNVVSGYAAVKLFSKSAVSLHLVLVLSFSCLFVAKFC